jgi:ornithine carbamoyltransferase
VCWQCTNALQHSKCSACPFGTGTAGVAFNQEVESGLREAGPCEAHLEEPDWQPPDDVVAIAHEIAGRTGARITIAEDSDAGVEGVDFIHTDVWVSMGESHDVWNERVKVLTPYQVSTALLEASGNPKARFMHCLPAFHDTDAVVGPRSWRPPA